MEVPVAEYSKKAKTNNFVAWKHFHVVTAVLARAQLLQISMAAEFKSSYSNVFSLCNRMLCPNFFSSNGNTK